jgi:hypothetical protein
MISCNNVGSISRIKKDEKKGTQEIVKTYGAIGLIEDFANDKESHVCKLSQ